ncbi:MAG: hypothetical protein HYU36_25055 [Planctomycetes bacterium]|nr:hypothetical protein [Planctomycetota bacterium]
MSETPHPPLASAPTTETRLTPLSKPRRWKTLFLATVLFLSGIALGGGAAVWLIRRQVIYALHHPEEAPGRILPILRRRLDLTDDQARKVKEILHRRQASLQDIRREVQPRVEAELDLVEKEVADVLDDGQKEKWHKNLRSLRATWTPPALAPQRKD